MSAIDGLIIREAEPEDAHGIWQVDRLTLEAWSEDSYVREIGSNKASIYFVAEKEDMILGFAGIWLIADEGHITNVAVRPEYLRKGVASTLLRHMLENIKNRGCTTQTLEVRKSNMPAVRLYEGLGFVEEAVRKEYYDDKEDALIFWRK